MVNTRRRTDAGKRRQRSGPDNTWFYLLVGGVVLFVLAIFLIIYLFKDSGNPFIKEVDPNLSQLLVDARRFS